MVFCRVAPLESLKPYKYVVVFSVYKGELLFSRHRQRETWETQGGHIEPGETPLEAARRELFEESGAADFDIYPLFDYHAWDEEGSSNGVVFAALIRRLNPLPESEMAEIRPFSSLPQALTYPGITPVLYRQAEALLDGWRKKD
ncbi:MAG: NUDIX domain-containing protein [Provencibacterium sp.]|jgi:8-oxo-dGTP diphosphatase|nr:NUDIX domain-containing protein [Provencibacterium sp.]